MYIGFVCVVSFFVNYELFGIVVLPMRRSPFPSSQSPPRRQFSNREPVWHGATAQLRSVPNGIDHDTADVHAASVHAQPNAYKVIRDNAIKVAPLTLNHNTLIVSSDAEAFAPDPRSTPYGADHTIARAEVEASSCSNPMAQSMRDDQDTHLTSLNFTCVGITPSGGVLTQHRQLALSSIEADGFT